MHIDVLPIPAATQDAFGAPFIAAGNHRSMFDLVTAFKVFGDLGINARPVSAEWLWDKPGLGRFLDSIGAIPMRSGRAYFETVEQCLTAVNAGDSLLLMPEGRLVPPAERVDGVGTGHKVLSKIATLADVPVIPAALTGTDDFWPHDRPLPKLRPTRVRIQCEFGEPRRYGANHRDNVDATIADLRSMLVQRDHAPVEPAISPKSRD